MEVIPYLASAGWYAAWLKAVADGMAQDDAIRVANDKENISGKDFTRCRIRGASTDTLLSLPVEGGTSRLKRPANIPHLDLSEHGNWRHVHIGALNAAYGRAPYYLHFMPMLEQVYNSGEKSLKTFNGMIHSAVVRMLFGNENPNEILSIYESGWSDAFVHPSKSRGKEIASNLDSHISIIDLLMVRGRESLLPLLSPLNSKL